MRGVSWARGWWHGNRRLQIGLLMLVPFLIAALVPSLIAPESPEKLISAPLQPPGSGALLGTDGLGRDIFSRLVHSARTDLGISLGSTLLSAVVGVAIGLAAGYRGGWIDNAALRVTDVMLAFPSILLALFLITIVGRTDTILVAALAVLFVPGFIRVARGTALSLRERAFVESSVISGAGSSYVTRRHLLPNALGPLLVGFGLTAAYALLAAATLSYLGLGKPPPAPSWGVMLQDAFQYAFQAWWYGLMPGLCIVWVSFAYLMISRGIDHAVARGPLAATAGTEDLVLAGPR